MRRRGGKRNGSRRRGGRKLLASGTNKYPAPKRYVGASTIVFQFRNLITVTSNGSAIISGFIPCDPSATLAAPFAPGAMFNEWTSVATLFSQIKCLQLECHFSPASADDVKGDTSIGVVIAGNLTSISNFATSYVATMDNVDSQNWNPLMDHSGRGRYHAIRHRPTLAWGGTSTPASSAAIYAGCVGGIGMYGSFNANATNFFNILVVGTYLLAQRS